MWEDVTGVIAARLSLLGRLVVQAFGAFVCVCVCVRVCVCVCV